MTAAAAAAMATRSLLFTGLPAHGPVHISSTTLRINFSPHPSSRLKQRLGVELHGFDRQFAMTDAHDDAVLRLGGDFKAGGKFLANRVERMVAADLEFAPAGPRKRPCP